MRACDRQAHCRGLQKDRGVITTTSEPPKVVAPQSETARAGDTSRFETQPSEPSLIVGASRVNCNPVDADDRKPLSTLSAQLALRGFSVYELASGGYLVARWDRTLHCSDLAQVRAFLERMGGST